MTIKFKLQAHSGQGDARTKTLKGDVKVLTNSNEGDGLLSLLP